MAPEPVVRRLPAGGKWIRTIGSAEKETAVERGPAADHCRLAGRPVLNNPIQLIGPGSPFGNSRETFRRAGPMVRIHLPPAQSQERTVPSDSSVETGRPRDDLDRDSVLKVQQKG